jgi:alkylation response protein AidB-like acyl-CoA dehydrogenase
VTGEHDTLRDTFRGFFTRESPPERIRAAETADPPGFDDALWTRVGALGVPDLAVEGASLAELAVVAEEYGRALAPIPMIETLVAARLLDRLDDSDLTAAGVEPRAPVTVALRPPRDGVATLVPAGAVARTVLALDGADLLLAHSTGPASSPPNVAAGPVADCALLDAAVIATGSPASAAYADALDDWRLLTAAALVGLARRALELGVSYATSRHQFGVPIGSFQALQHRLADVATDVDAAGLLVADAAAAPDPVASTRAYLAAVDAARAAAGVSLHVHGGYGFMLEYDIQLYFRRIKGWSLLNGDPRRELQRLADVMWGPPG